MYVNMCEQGGHGSDMTSRKHGSFHQCHSGGVSKDHRRWWVREASQPNSIRLATVERDSSTTPDGNMSPQVKAHTRRGGHRIASKSRNRNRYGLPNP